MSAAAGKKWFVVHAYSGFEKSVQRALLDRIKRSEIADQFGKILVPVEEVVEMKAGQKAISERKFFPGYVLVEMEMTDDSWHLVKSTPKVTGFVGGTANKPTPITQKEVDGMIAFYKTEAGIAVIEKMPQVMQLSMELVMELMQKISPRIQQISVDATNKLKATK